MYKIINQNSEFLFELNDLIFKQENRFINENNQQEMDIYGWLSLLLENNSTGLDFFDELTELVSDYKSSDFKDCKPQSNPLKDDNSTTSTDNTVASSDECSMTEKFIQIEDSNQKQLEQNSNQFKPKSKKPNLTLFNLFKSKFVSKDNVFTDKEVSAICKDSLNDLNKNTPTKGNDDLKKQEENVDQTVINKINENEECLNGYSHDKPSLNSKVQKETTSDKDQSNKDNTPPECLKKVIEDDKLINELKTHNLVSKVTENTNSNFPITKNENIDESIKIEMDSVNDQHLYTNDNKPKQDIDKITKLLNVFKSRSYSSKEPNIEEETLNTGIYISCNIENECFGIGNQNEEVDTYEIIE